MCRVTNCAICHLPFIETALVMYNYSLSCKACVEIVEGYWKENRQDYPKNGFEDFEDEIYNHGQY